MNNQHRHGSVRAVHAAERELHDACGLTKTAVQRCARVRYTHWGHFNPKAAMKTT